MFEEHDKICGHNTNRTVIKATARYVFLCMIIDDSITTSINTRATHGEHCVFVISYRNSSLQIVMYNHIICQQNVARLETMYIVKIKYYENKSCQNVIVNNWMEFKISISM
jgi:hypothetical protein